MSSSLPIRALLVEDLASDTELIARELERAGLRVELRCVATETEYVAALEPVPDIVVSDYLLPDFDALRVLAVLRERRLPVPVVVISGVLADVEAVGLLQHGVSEYVPKKQLGRLADAMERALEQARLRREKDDAEARVRQSERRFRALIENSSDLIAVVDESLVVRYVSPSLRSLLGYEPDEWLGRRVYDIVHPDDVAAVADGLREVVLGVDAGAPLVCRARHKDGSWRVLEATDRNLLDNDAVAGIVINARDITVRTRAQAELRRSEEALRHRIEFEELIASLSTRFINLAPADVDRGIEQALGAIARFTSTDRTSLFECSPDQSELFNTHGWSAPGFEPTIDNVRRLPLGSIPWLWERLRAGELVAIGSTPSLGPEAAAERELLSTRGIRALALIPVLVAGCVRGFLSLSMVRAERAWGAEMLARLQVVGEMLVNTLDRKRAAEAQSRLEAILDEAPDFIGIGTPELRALWVNRAARGILGLGPGDDVSQTWLGDYFTEDATQVVLREAMPIVLQGGVWRGDTSIRLRNGRSIPVSQVLIGHRGPDGAVSLVSTVCRDVSEEMRAREEMQRLNLRLEERVAARTNELEVANRELGQFASAVSHDLRGPLRTIDGYCRLLVAEHGATLASSGAEYLEAILRNATRMAQLIDDLLDLSRVTRTELSMEAVDLSALAHAVTAELRMRQPHRQTSVRIEEGLRARGDARLLRVMLENLLGNAWKYTSKKPGAHVELFVDGCEERRVYVVRDDGAGFDPRYADKLFQPFQRLHSVDEFEGIGIGLATVQRIVERHGGRIWAEAAPDKGASFYFTLA